MFISAIILGLLGSFHCVGMCGPIAFMLPVDRTNKAKEFLQVLSYHTGRLFTYALLGLLFGLIGKSFQLFGFQQQLSIFVGLLMIAVILLPKLFKKLKISNVINRFVIKVKSALGKELKNRGNDTFFVLGFLNGLLPCGLVYMAVFGAITMSNAFSGSLYMLFFGLGTIPLMTAVVYSRNFATVKVRQKVQKIIPYAVVFMGVLFVLRGLGLGIPYVSPAPVVDLVSNNAVCH